MSLTESQVCLEFLIISNNISFNLFSPLSNIVSHSARHLSGSRKVYTKEESRNKVRLLPQNSGRLSGRFWDGQEMEEKVRLRAERNS